jgi:hypothetical protein
MSLKQQQWKHFAILKCWKRSEGTGRGGRISLLTRVGEAGRNKRRVAMSGIEGASRLGVDFSSIQSSHAS